MYIYSAVGLSQISEPSSASASMPPGLKGKICPDGGSQTTDRCRDGVAKTCPRIPDLLCVTRVNDVPFEYVADGKTKAGKRITRIKRNPATGLYEVVDRVTERTQKFIPEVGKALSTFLGNMAAFGMPVAGILTMGSYYCRCVSGTTTLSNHSVGDALDIVGVRWSESQQPARTLPDTIIHNYNSGDQREMLLVRRINACLRLSFATVLDYSNVARPHCDHFHCDLRNRRSRERLPKRPATLYFVQESLSLMLGREIPMTGRWDQPTERGLMDHSKVSSVESLRRDHGLLNQVLDSLFTSVASGKIAAQPRPVARPKLCKKLIPFSA